MLNISPTTKKILLIIIVSLTLILTSLAIDIFLFRNKKAPIQNNVVQTVSSIPQEILDNRFGWLGGGLGGGGDEIKEKAGGWIRPHPGAFLWDSMQKSKTSEIDFTLTDNVVLEYQKDRIGILVTLWPFADWDQKDLPNASNCRVSDEESFLPRYDPKGKNSYLPYYRCNPNDWDSYLAFVKKVVERYDGDGIDDMPGLEIPVKYWEILNEPDLQYESNLPQSEIDRLNFYLQGPDEYAELLIKTFGAIKEADSKSKVLIAGAAGADRRMLDFYKHVFENTDALNSFDIGNIHCISNDQDTHDFNVNAYKQLLTDFGISSKPIWVTEAEAFYGQTAEENYQNTSISVSNAIQAGVERIFFTRSTFDDMGKDISGSKTSNNYPSTEKYREILKGYMN